MAGRKMNVNGRISKRGKKSASRVTPEVPKAATKEEVGLVEAILHEIAEMVGIDPKLMDEGLQIMTDFSKHGSLEKLNNQLDGFFKKYGVTIQVEG